MDRQQLEQQLAALPLFQYEFIMPEELTFSERIRHVCESECPMYNTTWACPPAVGTVEECREKCLSYRECFLFSTIASVSDVVNMKETLSTRKEHEEITASIEKFIRSQGSDCMALSTESCDICEHCAYPEAPCRFPEKMHPCLESHGIIVSELAEKFSMDFTLSPTEILWFSLIFLK